MVLALNAFTSPTLRRARSRVERLNANERTARDDAFTARSNLTRGGVGSFDC